MRDGLLRLYRCDAVPWLTADLDGDGSQEIVLALPVLGDIPPPPPRAAALFVLYRREGRWAVDRSDPLQPLAGLSMMGPALHGVADLAGLGRPQVIWSRPHAIGSGPPSLSVFVTACQPGSFTHLPGKLIIRAVADIWEVAVEGRDLILKGGSRVERFLRPRADRYRYVGGAFRLVDRRFLRPAEYPYDRLWDGLVAESVGRRADAEADDRAAMAPAGKVHPGTVLRHGGPPVELTPEEVAAFGEAVHALARLRLGALLLESGRREEALQGLAQGSGPFRGLAEAMGQAGDREAGCRAAAAWAAAHPAFLAALNRGAAHSPWQPEQRCGTLSLDEERPW